MENQKRLVQYLLAGLLLMEPVFACAQQEWRHYSFPEKHYRISFYKDAELTMDTIAFENTTVNTESWQLSLEDSTHDNNFYCIRRSEYPADFIHSDSAWTTVEELLDSSQSELMADKNYVLISSVPVEKNGYPGKVFRWRNNFYDDFCEFQVFLVGNVFYQLAVVARPGKDDNESVSTFFDSFGLLDVPDGHFRLPDNHAKSTYAITFPGTPSQEMQSGGAAGEKQTMLMQVFRPVSPEENLMYMAGETVLRDVPNDSIAREAFYKKTIDASMQALGCNLISVENILYAGNAGKEYRALVHEGGVLVYRMFIIGGHLYIVCMLTTNGSDDNIAMRRFFNSFKAPVSPL